MTDHRTSRRIEVRVPSRDFGEDVRTALKRLGYELVRARAGSPAPNVRILSGSRLRRLSDDLTEPVILLSGNPHHDDPRVAGILKRPVQLSEVYALLQKILETTPRAIPRIPTSLPVRSLFDGGDGRGAIISLSERGCCLRTNKALHSYGRIRLEFSLPTGGLINTWAAPHYRTLNETGLVFDHLSEHSRSSISYFVTKSLTS